MPDINVTPPQQSGQPVVIPAQSDQRYILNFAPGDEASISRPDGSDSLVFTFSNGGVVEIQDFYKEFSKDNLPEFEISGQSVAGVDFFDAFAPDISPAAGPSATGATGGNRYHDYGDAGLADGINHLNDLDWGMTLPTQQVETRQTAGLPYGGDEGTDTLAAVSPSLVQPPDVQPPVDIAPPPPYVDPTPAELHNDSVSINEDFSGRLDLFANDEHVGGKTITRVVDANGGVHEPDENGMIEFNDGHGHHSINAGTGVDTITPNSAGADYLNDGTFNDGKTDDWRVDTEAKNDANRAGALTENQQETSGTYQYYVSGSDEPSTVTVTYTPDGLKIGDGAHIGGNTVAIQGGQGDDVLIGDTVNVSGVESQYTQYSPLNINISIDLSYSVDTSDKGGQSNKPNTEFDSMMRAIEDSLKDFKTYQDANPEAPINIRLSCFGTSDHQLGTFTDVDDVLALLHQFGKESPVGSGNYDYSLGTGSGPNATTISGTSYLDMFRSYANQYNSTGGRWVGIGETWGTNYDAAFTGAGNYFGSQADGENVNIFITDGVPTAYQRPNGTDFLNPTIQPNNQQVCDQATLINALEAFNKMLAEHNVKNYAVGVGMANDPAAKALLSLFDNTGETFDAQQAIWDLLGGQSFNNFTCVCSSGTITRIDLGMLDSVFDAFANAHDPNATVDFSQITDALKDIVEKIMNIYDTTISGGEGSDTIFGDALILGNVMDDAFLNSRDANETTVDTIKAWLAAHGVADPTLDDVRHFVEDNAFKLADDSNSVLQTNENAADHIRGGDGDDVLFGQRGADTLEGGKGNDILVGGAGNDTLDGGEGTDIYVNVEPGDKVTDDGTDIFVTTGTGAGTSDGRHYDVAAIEQGDNMDKSGKDESYMLVGTGHEDRLTGGKGDDLLYGGRGDDILDGADGNDILMGGDGNDRIFGGLGDDKLYGGDGNDFLDGGAGRNEIHGGAGNDLIVYHEGDVISGDEGIDALLVDTGGTLDDMLSNMNSLLDGHEDMEIAVGGLDASKVNDLTQIGIIVNDDGVKIDMDGNDGWDYKGTSNQGGHEHAEFVGKGDNQGMVVVVEADSLNQDTQNAINSLNAATGGG
ncbi:MAG: hypothetical protein LBR31_00420 [Desulfovibrio sp.]|nr:hypothetical protein [Desulfovibrio sp.]